MAYADTLPDNVRRKARILAISSAVSGCISEVMLDYSAIIILLFTMLNASPTVTMFSSSLTGIMGVFLLIPYAYVVDKIGLKRAVEYACYIGCTGFLMIAVSPLLGRFAIPVALAGTFIYCSQRSLYGSAWYPLLDNFLRADERGKFFSTMRTCYMFFNGVLLFVLGVLLDKKPSILILQITIAAAGLCVLIRWFCIKQFPVDPELKTGNYRFRESLITSVRNAPLTGFSVYQCILVLASTTLLPLTLIYLRKYVHMEPGKVQLLSSIGIGGSICGYFLYGFVTRRVKLKWLELTVHLLFLILAFLLFYLDCRMPGFTVCVGTIIFLNAIATSWMLCNNSVEYLALARPGNKTMAISFCSTYSNLGAAIGRTGSSLLLGGVLLAPQWTFAGRTISVYQSIFLISGLIAVLALALIPILPSFVPEHEDYYKPGK
ncbi:MAG: MFS transporter [Lentisphaerae bacterium]|nr:MFS transporter [Lentisphaerota bacterium]